MEKIKDVSLEKKIYTAIKAYGKEVNESRAIPDYYDGLKPVQRKVLWAMHQLKLESRLVKSARLVGDVLGKYHPHGDKSVQDALTVLVNQSTSPIYGEGNWGSITGDVAAAMRYTLVRLSDYGNEIFDPYYLPALEMVPNYDGSEVEPVRLFPPLPNILLNGGAGIGVGVTVELPSYTRDSVKRVLLEAVKAEKATANMCLNLEFCTISNSKVDRKAQKASLLNFYNTGAGAVVHKPKLKVHGQSITVSGVAPFKGVNDYMKRLFSAGELAEIASINDQSRQWELLVHYTVKRGILAEDAAKKIESMLSSTKHYKVNITERQLVESKGWKTVQAQFSSASVPDILNRWIDYRLLLETRAANHHHGVLEQKYARNELLRKACANRDFLFGLTKSKDDDATVKQKIQRQLSCTLEEAAYVFDLKWRQLRSLEDAAVAEKMKEQRQEMSVLKSRAANPRKFLLERLQS